MGQLFLKIYKKSSTPKNVKISVKDSITQFLRYMDNAATLVNEDSPEFELTDSESIDLRDNIQDSALIVLKTIINGQLGFNDDDEYSLTWYAESMSHAYVEIDLF